MDVALDANIILSDPRMRGIAFHNLLAYLRKTDSRLVLSKIVLDETIARYPDRLRSALHKATGPIGSLRTLLFDAKVKLPDVDISRETKKLHQQLLKPSQHVRSSLIVKNFAKINLEDVVKRGIGRIPPANGAGEELRDVTHWLMILAHAQSSKGEIAFISEDEHFRKDNNLHPRLDQDVQDHKANLHFYVSIDEFIKAHAPAPRDLTESDAFALYPKVFVMDRFEIEARKFFPRRWPAAAIEIRGREVSLVRGALYQVAPHSQFGELEFSGELKIRVESELLYTNLNDYSRSIGQLGPAAPEYPSIGVMSSYSPSFLSPETFPFEVPPDPTPAVESAFLKTLPTFTYRPTTTSADYQATGRIVISVRVVNGKVTNIETDRFELTNIATG